MTEQLKGDPWQLPEPMLDLHTPSRVARNVLIEALGWPHVDAGEGRPIFALPPTELGIHPGDEPRHELSLLCDDITDTMAELRGEVSSSGASQTITVGASARPWFCPAAWMSCYSSLAIPSLTNSPDRFVSSAAGLVPKNS